MEFNKLNREIEDFNLLFVPVQEKDRNFINNMFDDKLIRRYYIVPKEARQDYRVLLDYWFNDMKNGAGTCWVIHKKSEGFFSSNKKVGFIAFEFRASLKNARISYAILPSYRRKGIAKKSIEIIIARLKNEGVDRVEADIDRDNSYSEKLVDKLGFTCDKSKALIDRDMMIEGDIRFRTLWARDLIDYTAFKYYILREKAFNTFINRNTVFKVFEDTSISDYSHGDGSVKYIFSLSTSVSENLVGISDDTTVHNITWELVREEIYKNRSFLILCGWGDPMTTGVSDGLPQFEDYEVAIEKELFAGLIERLISGNPSFFSIDKMRQVIGLDSLSFEIGQIRL